jgi:large subunit ribosomal protein L35e
LAQLGELRRNIARIKTVYNHQRKTNQRELWAKNKYKPIDLRRRQTRKQRNRLTPKQAAALTTRQAKKEAHFSKRVYALKE